MNNLPENADFYNFIAFEKREYNVNGFNAMDIKAGDFRALYGNGKADLKKIIRAMKDNMLEGDFFLSGEEGPAFAVRYYCDNLSDSRRHLF